MAILRAYFDNSDGPDREVAAFAGVVATPLGWERFTKDWLRALKRYGVESPFHMRLFAHGRAPYDRLSRDQRNALHIELIRAVKRHVRYGHCASVLRSECDIEELKDRRVKDFRDPYTLSMLGCLYWLAVASEKKQLPPGRIVCIYDDDQQRRGIAQRNHSFVSEHYFSEVFDPLFMSSNIRDSIPIQAADLLAYEGMKRVHSMHVARDDMPQRKSGEALFVGGRRRFSAVSLNKGVVRELAPSLLDYARRHGSALAES